MRKILRTIFAGKPVLADPYGLNAALQYRKDHRAELRAQERSDAAKRGWISRRAGA